MKARICGCGGMADASDSKSDVGDYVRVQVPPSALLTKTPMQSGFLLNQGRNIDQLKKTEFE